MGLVNDHTDEGTAISDTSPKLALLTLVQPVELQGAIQQLRQLCLVGYEPTSTLRIHDLTQIMIHESVEREGTQYYWFRVAMILACVAFRYIEDFSSYKCWAQCETLSPHIQSLTIWDDKYAIGSSELDRANIDIAEYWRSLGRYGEAAALLERVLARWNEVLGAEHPDTLGTVHNLTYAYEQLGQYTKAEELYGRALTGNENLFGPEHPDTLRAVHNLACLYLSQGRLNGAERFHGWALQRNVAWT